MKGTPVRGFRNTELDRTYVHLSPEGLKFQSVRGAGAGVAALARQPHAETAAGTAALRAELLAADAALHRGGRAGADGAEVPLDLPARDASHQPCH